MNITYIHQYFNTPEMAGGTRSYEMAKRLVSKNHNVNMITSWREGGKDRWFQEEEAGFKIHWLPVRYSNKMGYKERVKSFLHFAWAASLKASTLKADVIFATSTPLTVAIPGIFASIRQKVPMVFEVRDLWPEMPIAIGALRNPILIRICKKLEWVAYRQSKMIVALSTGMKDGIVSTGIQKHKVAIIPNCSDIDFFNNRKNTKNRFRSAHPEIGYSPLIVYAGSFGKINNVCYMAHIAAEAQKMNLPMQFVAVGRGSEEDKIRKEAIRLGILEKNFHMYPAVPKREMPEILSAADLAISLFLDLKPMWSNSANKFFDALASGTPIAINYGGWQADLIKKTGAGIVMPPNAPMESAKLLFNLIEDKERLARAGYAARKLAEEQFNREKLADQLEKVLLFAIEKQL